MKRGFCILACLSAISGCSSTSEQYLSVERVSPVEERISALAEVMVERANRVEQLKKAQYLNLTGNSFQTSEIDSNITEIQKILSTQLLNQDNSFDNISLAFAVSFYESKDAEVKKALEYLKQRAEDKGIFESLLKNKNPKGGSSKKRELTVRKETRSRSYSAGAAGISIAAIGTAITIIRGLYALLGPSNSTDYSNNYYQEQQVNYRTPDFEIRNIQKDLIFKQSIGETTNNQPLEFNRSNVEFVSDLAKYPFPGPHTVIKNETQKNIVFFYNTHFGGFRYKLVYPETSDTVIFRYQYFLIYRGKNPCNGSYTSNNKIKNVGFLFNDFDESDKKLLNTLYINKSQKLRKQSVIFIYGDSVLISEKS